MHYRILNNKNINDGEGPIIKKKKTEELEEKVYITQG